MLLVDYCEVMNCLREKKDKARKSLEEIYVDFSESTLTYQKFFDFVAPYISLSNEVRSLNEEGSFMLTQPRFWITFIELNLRTLEKSSEKQKFFIENFNNSIKYCIEDKKVYKVFFLQKCKELFDDKTAFKMINLNPNLKQKIEDYNEIPDNYRYLLINENFFDEAPRQIQKIVKIDKEKIKENVIREVKSILDSCNISLNYNKDNQSVKLKLEDISTNKKTHKISLSEQEESVSESDESSLQDVSESVNSLSEGDFSEEIDEDFSQSSVSIIVPKEEALESSKDPSSPLKEQKQNKSIEFEAMTEYDQFINENHKNLSIKTQSAKTAFATKPKGFLF